MKHKAPHVILGKFFRENRGVAETFAHPFGVCSKIPSSWGRPKASDTNPTGTGNNSPLNGTEKLMEMIHQYDPATVHEIADNMKAFACELDRREGAIQADSEIHFLKSLAHSIREHADVAECVLEGDLEGDLDRAMVEVRQAESALLQLKGGLAERQQDGGVQR